MKIIKEEFTKIIAKRREFQSKISSNTDKTEEVIESFEHFTSLIDGTTLGIPNVNNLINNTNINYEIEAFHFLMKISISYSLRYYDSLCLTMKDRHFHPWEDKKNKELDIFILLIWKENLYSIISAYSLLLNDCIYQAMQLMRNYIESSATLYLSLLDIDFILAYTNNEYTEEEYMKIWFKKLKPEKVKKKITNIHAKWEKEDKEKNVQPIGLRGIPNIITSDFFQRIYSKTSDYIHFNKNSLFDNSYSLETEKLYIGLNNPRPLNKNLIIMFIEALSNTSNLMEMAAQSHTSEAIIKYNGIMGDFSELNFSLQTNCGYMRGMYDIEKN